MSMIAETGKPYEEPVWMQGHFSSVGPGMYGGHPDLVVTKCALQVDKLAGMGGWVVWIEASLDGKNWTKVLDHTNTSHSDGQVVWPSSAIVPFKFWRVNVTSMPPKAIVTILLY